MKISKSIILPEFEELTDLEQVSNVLRGLTEALRTHNITNYDDAVASHRTFKFTNLISNPDYTLIDGGKITTGSITADKYNELRNTYVFNGDDSLDATYPFELDFEIVSEMTAIESVKLSFRIRKFRSYTKAGAAAGTPSGGGSTSGATGSASGGGATSGASSGYALHSLGDEWATSENIGDSNINGFVCTSYGNIQICQGSHTHATPNHTHPNHTHSTPAHTHPNHTHTAVYGIFEEDTSPTINVYIDNGAGYGDSIGNYAVDQLDIDITSHISGTGFKRIKFTSNVRARVVGWVMCKIDLTA